MKAGNAEERHSVKSSQLRDWTHFMLRRWKYLWDYCIQTLCAIYCSAAASGQSNHFIILPHVNCEREALCGISAMLIKLLWEQTVKTSKNTRVTTVTFIEQYQYRAKASNCDQTKLTGDKNKQKLWFNLQLNNSRHLSGSLSLSKYIFFNHYIVYADYSFWNYLI